MGGGAGPRGPAWCAFGLLLILGPAAAPPGAAAEPSEEPVDTGERFVHPATGTEFRVLRHRLGGRKEIEAPDGARHASIDAAVLAEDSRLPPHRRLLDRALWAAAEDPARASEIVRVALVLRRQPVRDESLARRPQLREEMGARLAALRRILARIAERREPDPERRMRVGERAEEEARLLTPVERAEVDRIRAEVVAASRESRAAILAAARPVAESDHAEVAAALARIDGARVLGTSLAFSTVTIEIPAGRLRTLDADLPGVARVLPSGTSELSTDTSVGAIGGGSWTGGGVDGSGVRVGILDTGIDDSHPALQDTVTAAKAFPEFDQQGQPYGNDDMWHGHGTHVAGIVGSRDATYPGVAPGASFINARCFLGVSAASYWIWRAGDFAAAEGADVMNCSFGSAGVTNGSHWDSIFFDAVVGDLGISVAAGAGNTSAVGQYNRPADGFNLLGVSSFWDKGTVDGSDDVISTSSAPGPMSDGRLKPDLAAPGVDVVSCAYDWEDANPDFVSKTGTSMATPHTAGAQALLTAHAASWRPEGIRALILANLRISSPVPAPHDASWGWGALDLASAWTNRGSVFESSFTDGGDEVVWLVAPSMAKGQRVFLCWGRDASYTSGTYFMSYRSPVDLDISVYDSATGAFLGESAKTLDSVEGVTLSAGSSAPLIKVKRAGGFPSGQTSVDWALALDAASAPSAAEEPAIPSAPSIAIGFDVPSLRIGETTVVRATVANDGDLALPAGIATLRLPPGVVFSGEGAPAESLLPLPFAAIGPGEETEVEWTVARLPGPGPVLDFEARADLEAFGESLTTGWIAAGLAADGGPWGHVLLDGGADVTRQSTVALGIQVVYGDAPVTHMLVRRPGEEWGAAMAFSPDSLHELEPGVGPRALKVRLVDAAGRESVTISDSIFLDGEAPTGLFVLSGDAPYLMPWQALTADVSGDDGEGSGLESLRLRWVVDGAPGSWTPLPLDGSSLPLERPSMEDARAEVQFLDVAGNASAILADRIRLVDPGAPPISSVRSLRGVLGPGGDVDGYPFTALRDDILSVRVKTKRVRGVPETPLALDLYAPSGAKVATGRYPEDAETVGIGGFWAGTGGRHWVVVRAEGPVPEGGVEYTLSIRVKRLRTSLTLANWTYGGGPKEIPFTAVEGTVLTGVIGFVTGPPMLRGPDGTVVPVEGRLVDDSWRLTRTTLAGGDGTYLLLIPATGNVFHELRMKPPRAGRFTAPDE